MDPKWWQSLLKQEHDEHIFPQTSTGSWNSPWMRGVTSRIWTILVWKRDTNLGWSTMIVKDSSLVHSVSANETAICCDCLTFRETSRSLWQAMTPIYLKARSLEKAAEGNAALSALAQLSYSRYVILQVNRKTVRNFVFPLEDDKNVGPLRNSNICSP